ncbi:extradiol dioxygenase [Chryseobacterium sp. Leaf180]|uniref:VOC family protein n=1 Tax=Chryseobacterium sp. Leaf180 TaxID=1736289 RepID=UPI0006FDDBD1|nr:VOC family protein [Chryseobacterium sp. Leaf180]KQR91507.1 extradiol dioxygenase [Chryseobacterium sp. Leaf180]
MEINQFFVNLPVKDVAKTREFWLQLGFKTNDEMSDDRSVCVVLKENANYLMFLAEEYFQTFSEKPLPKEGTQFLLAIALNTREEVDQLVNKAVEQGATQHEETQDHGFMYQNSFWDINGFGWNVIFSDVSKAPVQDNLYH